MANNLSSKDSYTYILSNDAIFTNFTTDEVEIAYNGISTDENGWLQFKITLSLLKL